MDKDRIVTLLKYKRWIDSETLKSLTAIDDTADAGKRHLMLRLMNHIYVVDRIFEANMSGEPHGYTALNTPEIPTAEALEASMTACTERYIQRVSRHDARRCRRGHQLHLCRRRPRRDARQ